jgi:glycerate 2-kinase
MTPTREQALSIWTAAVEAADPFTLTRDAAARLSFPGRALVVGGGKAGAAMAAGVEAALADRVTGVVNVPAGSTRPLKFISLVEARPAGSNHPTAAGVAGVGRMLALVEEARPGDVGLCLLSGGGSALLPAPSGLTLEDKQQVTKLLHASGAAIGEMNCVRKHLSRFKGGRLAEAFARRGIPLTTLILSDVVGDPLDVIASGPTAPDPTTCEDALDVLRRYGLLDAVPAVRRHLESGDETPKALPAGVRNEVIGNNARSLAAAARRASQLGYTVLNLGSFIEGEARHVAAVLAGIVRGIRRDYTPVMPPACVLAGGETTVALPPDAGKGGRNQELALAALLRLRGEPVVLLSGGTDGEDGPTDAAGAVFDARTPADGAAEALRRHDAYTFFDRVGGLVRTGLTGTNVMDVCVILIG